MIDKEVIEFLRESNNIENVWDDDSLVQAVDAWNSIIYEEELSSTAILIAHWKLMVNQNIKDKDKGYFRERPVFIGGKEAKPHFALDSLMDDWCNRANGTITQNDRSILKSDKSARIKVDHIEFEKIHPFIDGNGRMGRILLNWQRIKSDLPILIIKNDEKKEYYKWFV